MSKLVEEKKEKKREEKKRKKINMPVASNGCFILLKMRETSKIPADKIKITLIGTQFTRERRKRNEKGRLR